MSTKHTHTHPQRREGFLKSPQEVRCACAGVWPGPELRGGGGGGVNAKPCVPCKAIKSSGMTRSLSLADSDKSHELPALLRDSALGQPPSHPSPMPLGMNTLDFEDHNGIYLYFCPPRNACHDIIEALSHSVHLLHLFFKIKLPLRDSSPKEMKNSLIIYSPYMPMEGWVKCLSPRNTFGVSGVNSVETKSNTIEVNCEHFFKHKKNNKKNPLNASILLLR